MVAATSAATSAAAAMPTIVYVRRTMTRTLGERPGEHETSDEILSGL